MTLTRAEQITLKKIAQKTGHSVKAVTRIHTRIVNGGIPSESAPEWIDEMYREHVQRTYFR